jgi:hypothetical protein
MSVCASTETLAEILAATESQLEAAFAARFFPSVTPLSLTIFAKLADRLEGCTTHELARFTGASKTDVRRGCEALAAALLIYAPGSVDCRVRLLKETTTDRSRRGGMPMRRYRLAPQPELR